MEAAKRSRRSAKGMLTRAGKTVTKLLEMKRPACEVYEALKTLKAEYTELSQKHVSYCELLDDDELYEEEERWMEVCWEERVNLEVAVNDYASSIATEDSQLLNVEPKESQDTAHSIDSDNVKATQTNTDDGTIPTERRKENTESGFKLRKEFLPTFSGDVREFGIFQADFKHIVDSKCSNRDAITLLRSCLKGKAAELIRGIKDDYTAAWEYLESVYGDARYVADAVTNDLASFECLDEGEDARFCELVHLVRRSFNTLNEMGRSSDMDNNHVLALIEQKMCSNDRRNWSRDLEKEKKPASFKMLLEWMSTEMRARMRSSAPLRNAVQSDDHVADLVAGRSTYAPNVRSSRTVPAATLPDKCWLCRSSDHWIDQCPKLNTMSPEERLQKVKDNHGCFCCLKRAGRNHTYATCYRRRQCQVMNGREQCKQYHHSLLHGANQNTNVGVGAVMSNTTLLPVLSVRALGTRGLHQIANTLVDSGAQISLIRNDLARDLQLKGRHASVTISTVGGQFEEMNTKIYTLRVQSLENDKTYNVDVIGIPSISDDIACVHDMDSICESLQLATSCVRRGSGSVDLLIGIDHPKLHMGETRGGDNVVARHSPMGWVIFGTANATSSRVSRVFHVKICNPVDLTEFWSTESMGVMVPECNCDADMQSKQEREEGKLIEDNCTKVGNQWQIAYPWKRNPADLPNNKSQALKKLETTERRLQNNEKNATDYDAQIKEMEQMKFSRKLTDDEIDSYDGPVHYIAHHAVLRPDSKSTPVRIVFNTSASYQGHKLNEYWYKGPDMLNNMFGVIIRFRENDIAICADISKMYHRILIPELDQHVHRFLYTGIHFGERAIFRFGPGFKSYRTIFSHNTPYVISFQIKNLKKFIT